MAFHLPDAAETARWFRRHRTTQDSIALLSAFLWGVLTHLYLLVNKLPNHDDFLSTFTANDYPTSGRWFLKFPSALSSQMSVPWINGMLSLVFLSLACLFLVRLLRMKRSWCIVLACGVLTTFPTVGHTLIYMYTADAYCFALLLAVLACYLTDRYPLGFLAGGVLLGLSMGCYQAYVFFALALLGVRGLLVLTDPDFDDGKILRLLLRFLALLALGGAVYLAGSKLTLWITGQTLTSYMGIDQMGSGGIAGLLRRIPDAYRAYFAFVADGENYLFTGRLQRLFFLLTNLAAVGGLLLAMGNTRKKSPLQWALLLLLIPAFPLLFNGVYLAGAEMVHTLMLYALSLPYVLVIALYDRRTPPASEKRRTVTLALGWALAVSMTVLPLQWASRTNQTYFALELKFDNMMALANRIVDRVEQTPGYTPGTPVWFQGVLSDGNYPFVKPDSFARVSNTPATGFESEYGFFMNNMYFRTFVQNYLGVSFPRPETAEVERILSTDSFLSMPYFPESGSVKLIDGILFVRVGPGGTVL